MAWGLGWWAFGYPWAPSSQPGVASPGLASDLTPVGAFVIAALIQRVVLAEYTLKAGPFELTQVQQSLSESLTGVQDRLIRRVEDSDLKTAQELAGIKTGMAALQGRVDRHRDAALKTDVALARLDGLLEGVLRPRRPRASGPAGAPEPE